MTETRTHLHTVLTDLADVVGGVGDDQWRTRTPCSEFDVDALVDHVAGWSTTFATGYADPEGRAPGGPTAVEGDRAAAIRTAADRMDEALAAGAAQRPLSLGGAAMPGEMALSMILWEYQVHGWDLATALGRPWSPDPEGLEASLAFAPMMLTDDYQGEGKPFAARVPVAADAPALDRLVAISGRDPHWSA
ncbi:TIGR03086 family metal-binding protein [Actinomycetospora termitidis]|uniref:TIGR03086 family metal-binding protein n=1 Tax=Actinomycetospora termitidis TaxID=3053470 RepID=A0ABT7M3Z7_9PSEU|nr:TIGR03086 family metal-binding protein [Actinomycetospora sp. Odt1-22]MDL5155391.1 TIGR03086 family metal-binding protein [Actinomycetospora sp. Odt1-22]